VLEIHYDKDADLELIKGKKVAIIGYGSQGHAHALNLHDSGVDVVVGLKAGSKSIAKAEEAGLKVMTTAEAAAWGDVVVILAPDQVQRFLFADDVKPNLTPGKTLVFGHGFNIRFGYIEAPEGVDVILVAPKGPGHTVRREYEAGRGVPVIVAVENDASGKAWDMAWSYSKALGALRAGGIKTTFTEETETDLFGEQSVLCGGTSQLVMYGFETLVEAGYQPEMAYFEVLHELKLIVDMINESGISGMRFSISETAKYGDITRGPRVINSSSRKAMRDILKEIQSGKFTAQWVKEYKGGLKNYNKLLKKGENHPIEKTGQRLRALMPWVQKRNIRGAQAEYTTK
jgi:ketol-acid reductoisomerase